MEQVEGIPVAIVIDMKLCMFVVSVSLYDVLFMKELFRPVGTDYAGGLPDRRRLIHYSPPYVTEVPLA